LTLSHMAYFVLCKDSVLSIWPGDDKTPIF
jgi:hypothetical protein